MTSSQPNGTLPAAAEAAPAPDKSLLADKLKTALRQARIDDAEHGRVVAELRGAEIARLEMLRDALLPLIAEVPKEVDFFDIALVPSEHPRLFIDMIAFVEMGRDRRSYRFIQDTRLGRVTLAESERIELIVTAITDYIARRLIERDKALAGDTTLEQAARAQIETQEKLAQRHAPAAESKLPRRHPFAAILGFLIELTGSIVLAALVGLGGWTVWKYISASAWLARHAGGH